MAELQAKFYINLDPGVSVSFFVNKLTKAPHQIQVCTLVLKLLSCIALYVNTWTQELLLMNKCYHSGQLICFNNQTKCRQAF